MNLFTYLQCKATNWMAQTFLATNFTTSIWNHFVKSFVKCTVRTHAEYSSLTKQCNKPENLLISDTSSVHQIHWKFVDNYKYLSLSAAGPYNMICTQILFFKNLNSYWESWLKTSFVSNFQWFKVEFFSYASFECWMCSFCSFRI